MPKDRIIILNQNFYLTTKNIALRLQQNIKTHKTEIYESETMSQFDKMFDI